MTQNRLPRDFELRLKGILPERPAFLFKPRPYQSFRINTLKISVEEAYSLLVSRKIVFQKVNFCPYAIIVDKPAAQEILKSDLVNDGLLYAQGLESLLPVIVLDPRPNERVIDLCAAPGSKTSQIAMHMNNQGTLKANEPVRQRLYKLKSVLQLTGAHAQILSTDGRRLRATASVRHEDRATASVRRTTVSVRLEDHEDDEDREHNEIFDRILIDAPCSCECRFIIDEPQSFAYWSVRKIKEMSHKQKGLLLNSSRLLAPGGILVYATCTFAPEENEEVVDWFLRKTNGRFELVPMQMKGIKTYPCLTQWNGNSYYSHVANAMRILPDERMGGFFIAKFKNCHYK